jgi:hypothetical protein
VGKLTERALRAKHRVNPCVRCLLDRERASAAEPSRFWLGSAAAPAGEALTPRTARTPSLIRGEGSERLVRLNYEPALVALDDVLGVRIFMPRRQQEPAIPPANAQVVREAHGEPLSTGSAAAFAEKPEFVAFKRIVDFTQELLILGVPTRSLDRCIRHGLGVGHASEITCPGPTGGKLIADAHREPAR